MKEQIKPGFFGKHVTADDMRIPFDIRNEQLLFKGFETDYLFIGDSITQHWDLDLYFNDGVIINRGIGGDTTDIILRRSDADVFQFNPKKIIYLAGINDLLTTAPDLWWNTLGAEPKKTIDDLALNIEKFIIKCEKSELFLCSVLPVSMCLPYNTFNIDGMVLEVNEKIKALCEKYGVLYIDYHKEVCDENGKSIKEGLTHDGVHPNGKCYQKMAEVLNRETGIKLA